MRVERLDNVNDDLSVVNAARVSFAKESEYVWDENGYVVLPLEDIKLIKYLAKHNHWTPFGHLIFCYKHRFTDCFDAYDYVLANQSPGIKFHVEETDKVFKYVELYESFSLYALMNKKEIPSAMYHNVADYCLNSVNALSYMKTIYQPPWQIEPVTGEDIPAPLRWARFRISMPIFVAREWFRHTKGFVRNEVSRRYVETEPECWLPDSYRVRHENKKQGSGAGIPKKDKELVKSAKLMTDMTVEFYNTLLKEGVAPEMARHILPQSMYTEFIETAYIEDYERLLGLRLQPDAQQEIQEVAQLLKEELYE